MNSNSPAGKLNNIDWKKALMVLLFYLLGSVIAFVGTYVLNLDFGVYTVLVGQVIGFVIHLVKKWFNDYTASHNIPIDPLVGKAK